MRREDILEDFREKIFKIQNWLQIRIRALWIFFKWIFHAFCCCGICLEREEQEGEGNDLEKGIRNKNPFGPGNSIIVFFEKGVKNTVQA